MSTIQDGVVVEIINWEKYNQRKDVKSPSWFRMDHGLFENPEFYDFTQGELLVWIYLLCVASRKSNSIIRVSYSHAERIGRLKTKDIESAILKLQSLQALLVDGTSGPADGTRSPADGTSGPATLHNKQTNNTLRPPVAFEECYQKYPRKEGKSGGLKIYAKLNDEDRTLVAAAIENYARRKAGTEIKYLKLFSSFMAEWRDWLDPVTGGVASPAPQFKSIAQLKAEGAFNA